MVGINGKLYETIEVSALWSTTLAHGDTSVVMATRPSSWRHVRRHGDVTTDVSITNNINEQCQSPTTLLNNVGIVSGFQHKNNLGWILVGFRLEPITT